MEIKKPIRKVEKIEENKYSFTQLKEEILTKDELEAKLEKYKESLACTEHDIPMIKRDIEALKILQGDEVAVKYLASRGIIISSDSESNELIKAEEQLEIHTSCKEVAEDNIKIIVEVLSCSKE